MRGIKMGKFLQKLKVIEVFYLEFFVILFKFK